MKTVKEWLADNKKKKNSFEKDEIIFKYMSLNSIIPAYDKEKAQQIALLAKGIPDKGQKEIKFL